MTKGRKTTYNERVEIVAFCIENNYNYQLTSDKYKVSYQQVYTWVRKYKANGYESLRDNRGKRKNILINFFIHKNNFLVNKKFLDEFFKNKKIHD